MGHCKNIAECFVKKNPSSVVPCKKVYGTVETVLNSRFSSDQKLYKIVFFLDEWLHKGEV
jgi:hypothetical protein